MFEDNLVGGGRQGANLVGHFGWIEYVMMDGFTINLTVHCSLLVRIVLLIKVIIALVYFGVVSAVLSHVGKNRRAR